MDKGSKWPYRRKKLWKRIQKKNKDREENEKSQQKVSLINRKAKISPKKVRARRKIKPKPRLLLSLNSTNLKLKRTFLRRCLRFIVNIKWGASNLIEI